MSLILVVDDMATIRDLIAESLQASGYQTMSATNGKEALDRMRTCKPDLVLLDVGMPVMDGLKAIQEMKRDPQLMAIPVILLTAFSDRKNIVQAGQLGVRDYVLKTKSSLREILDRIKRYLAPAATETVPAVATSANHALGTASTSMSRASNAAVPSATRSVVALPIPATAPSATIPAILTREQCALMCLARDPSLSSSDPITAALHSLGRFDVMDHLPKPTEWKQEYAGLVIAGRSPLSDGFVWPDVKKCLRLLPSTPLVLWLVGKMETGTVPPAAPCQPRTWPIALDELVKFVQVNREGEQS